MQRAGLIVRCLLLLLVFATPASARQSDYDRLLEKAKQDPLSINFIELREAYVRLPDYSGHRPIGARDKPFWTALEARNFAEAERLLNEMLAECYVRAYAHVMATRLYEMRGDHTRATFHEITAKRLVQATSYNRDGRSPRTAFFVVNVTEEYDLMHIWGLRRGIKALVEADGRTYDVWAVSPANRPGETFQLHFDVTAAMVALGRALQPPRR